MEVERGQSSDSWGMFSQKINEVTSGCGASTSPCPMTGYFEKAVLMGSV